METTDISQLELINACIEKCQSAIEYLNKKRSEQGIKKLGDVDDEKDISELLTEEQLDILLDQIEEYVTLNQQEYEQFRNSIQLPEKTSLLKELLSNEEKRKEERLKEERLKEEKREAERLRKQAAREKKQREDEEKKALNQSKNKPK
jgi:hypothetical protein